MSYLFVKLFWYVLLAFVIGLIVGWFTCTSADEDYQ